MHLFGHHDQPRLVNLRTRRQTGSIVLTWDVRRGQALRWRVLRSERGYAAGPFDDAVAGGGQTLVSDHPQPGSHDPVDDADGTTRFYTVFAEDERGEWRRLATTKVDAGDPSLTRRAEGDFEAGGPRPGSMNPSAVEITKAAVSGQPRR